MLKSAWFVLRTDVWHLVRSREALLWLFVMPVLFIYFIGTITGRFASGSASGPDKLALRAPPDAGFLVDRLITHLEANGYRVVHPTAQEDFVSNARRLTIPEGFTKSVLAGRKVIHLPTF